MASLPILEDLSRVLFYPHIRKRHRFSDEEIHLFVDALTLATTLSAGHIEVKAVKDDPSDNKTVACALEAKVDYIVASDEHLTKLGGFEGIPIVPRDVFWRFLKRDESSQWHLSQRRQAPLASRRCVRAATRVWHG